MKLKAYFLCLVLAAFALAQNSMRGPWESFSNKNQTDHEIAFPNLQYAFFIYHNYISPIDGDNRCSFYPTCSHYSEEAFLRHGLFWGFLMTFDRLQRCGFDSGRRIIVRKHLVIFDPLAKNDFWLDERFGR